MGIQYIGFPVVTSTVLIKYGYEGNEDSPRWYVSISHPVRGEALVEVKSQGAAIIYVRELARLFGD